MHVTRHPLVLGMVIILALGLVGIGTLLAPSASVAQSGSEQGWLGISLQDLNRNLREALDLTSDTDGAVITDVVKGSPAADAGLQEQDVVVSVDGRNTGSTREVIDAVRSFAPGDRVVFRVIRDGRNQSFPVRLASFESAMQGNAEAPRDDDEDGKREVVVRLGNGDEQRVIIRDGKGGDDERVIVLPDSKRRVIVRGQGSGDLHFKGSNRGYLGVQTTSLTGQLAEYFGVEPGQGVLVSEVVQGSPAAEAGLVAGDVLVRVDDQAVTSHDSLREIVRSHEKGDALELTVVRRGARRTLNAVLGSSSSSSSNNWEFDGNGLHEMLGNVQIPGMNMRGFDVRKRGDRTLEIDIPELEFDEGEMEALHESMRELQEELHEMLDDLKFEIHQNSQRWQRDLERAKRDLARESHTLHREAPSRSSN